MRSCWTEDPSLRPQFSSLTQQLEAMLNASADYLELESLIVSNQQYFMAAGDHQGIRMSPQFLTIELINIEDGFFCACQ